MKSEGAEEWRAISTIDPGFFAIPASDLPAADFLCSPLFWASAATVRSAAVGLGGRERRMGSPAERARVAVTRAVRRAIDRVREHHPELADHLEGFIRTGTYCAYVPDPRVGAVWKVGGR